MGKKQIDLLDSAEFAVFGVSPDPSEFENYELLDDSMRGPKGAIVAVHKNDVAALRANRLIGDAPAAEAKPKKATHQPKSEAKPPKLTDFADAPAVKK